MPAFMGTLQLGETQQLKQALAGATDPTRGSNAIVLPTTEDSEVTVTDTNHNAAPQGLWGKRVDTDIAVVLENVVAGFTRPNILDVKLGKRLWADDAPPAKRAKLEGVASQTTSGALGFRVAGMKIWRPDPNPSQYQVYDKWYGRSRTTQNVREAFQELLCVPKGSAQDDMTRDVIANVADAVKEVEEVVRNQESRMYSASLLLVYEGDDLARQEAIQAAIERQGLPQKQNIAPEDENEADEDDDDDDESAIGEEKKLFDLRVIDFAHAAWTPGQGPDLNVLCGIHNIARILDELAQEG